MIGFLSACTASEEGRDEARRSRDQQRNGERKLDERDPIPPCEGLKTELADRKACRQQTQSE
jgi:hypothetical protein